MSSRRLASALVLGLSLAACASGSPSASTGSASATATDIAATTAPSSSAPATTSAASATTAAPTSSASAPGEHITGPYVLTAKQTGGIAAFRMETVIDSAARSITFGGPRNQRPETRPLTEPEVASLTRLLDSAGLTSFSGPIKGPPVADAFTYELSLHVGAGTRTVSWSDGASPPAAIAQIQSFVTKLRNEKFGASPTKDAPVQ